MTDRRAVASAPSAAPATSPARRQKLVFARNIAANAAGRGWSMLMNFAFVPAYIALLGIESYGVIAFFATLSALFSFLDLGLSSTLNRELARRTGSDQIAESAQDVVRTLELLYWGIGLLVSGVIVVAAPFIASHWLNAKGISDSTLANAIRIMGVVIALHWPSGLYSGGLSGLQKQVWTNGLDIVFATARGFGAIGILYFVSRTVQGFFLWQLCISAMTVFTLRAVLLRQLGKSARRPRFNKVVLVHTWRFAGGMTGLSIVSIILMYADKVVLSAMLPLAVYARYMLANTLAAASAMFAFAVFNAMYPRLTQLVAGGTDKEVRQAYHAGTQIIVIAVVPAALVVFFFSRELLSFWTRDAVTAASQAPIASLLVVGTALNSLMMAPYALQLAHGSTRLNIIANVVSVIILVPGTYILTRWFGPIGAACLWPVQNIGYILFLAPAVHRRFLHGVSLKWYLSDIALPSGAAFVVTVGARAIVPVGLAPLMGFVLAGLAGMTALVACGLATGQGRAMTGRLLRGLCKRTAGFT